MFFIGLTSSAISQIKIIPKKKSKVEVNKNSFASTLLFLFRDYFYL